jgi:hypothetical protein
LPPSKTHSNLDSVEEGGVVSGLVAIEQRNAVGSGAKSDRVCAFGDRFQMTSAPRLAGDEFPPALKPATTDFEGEVNWECSRC